jgi:hypothetical protein
MTCVYQNILSLVLLSITAHDRDVLSYSVRRQFLARASSSSARYEHRRLFIKTAPCELNPSPVAAVFQMEINCLEDPF